MGHGSRKHRNNSLIELCNTTVFYIYIHILSISIVSSACAQCSISIHTHTHVYIIIWLLRRGRIYSLPYIPCGKRVLYTFIIKTNFLSA